MTALKIGVDSLPVNRFVYLSAVPGTCSRHESINKILDSAQKELEPPKVKYSRKIGLERTEEYRFVAETIKNIEIQNRREILRFLETAERNGT